ncbi:hypothetical protein FGSG_13504 [Fusarium graminearum PH-1]|uniref:Chromosome 4, complete genome n=1 Tax=Gibberella zeae (strain ATCC MYA-4620 / CBS 123657 / FGSC 9075 / NRRL 31084 / PH-1) TaxID=229533 RepID=I1S9H3_GIBZE|nr:hypothetical protein FGSG_13504 [Fusarium graminearum PH-1]ESU15547.1 hypothetical protein FGSG_13504 [Fusarium graminearum PH-1]CEF84545.1 unnamed protein product [Fusarium graminearum]|eukprot:XP_011328769.1 hypothetical protein FGSG_13504 [Fusarium graminearum PH-1]
MDDTPKARLPMEIILSIIESLIPETTSHSRPMFPASHLITTTLLDLTLVCKAVYPIASRLLWKNCLRIESNESLRLFRDFISRESVVTGRRPCEAYGSTRLFLAPFGISRLSSPEPESINEEAFNPISYSPVSPYQPELKDMGTAEAVNEVLITLAPVLKAIIVEMPLRSLWPDDDDTGIRRVLREGFEALVNVEELVSINDELYLDTNEDGSELEVWTKWPKLRRLALYNVMAGPELWKNMLLCPQLEIAVFPRADPSGNKMSEENIKDDWSRAWTEATSQRTMSFEDRIPYRGRNIDITFYDWETEFPNFDAFTDSWGRLDPDNLIRIMTVPFNQPYDPALARHEYQPFKNYPKVWIRGRALSGSLWDAVYRERCST